jgi:hypothetical protein
LHHLEGNELVPPLLEPLDDLADESTLDTIGLIIVGHSKSAMPM